MSFPLSLISGCIRYRLLALIAELQNAPRFEGQAINSGFSDGCISYHTMTQGDSSNLMLLYTSNLHESCNLDLKNAVTTWRSGSE